MEVSGDMLVDRTAEVPLCLTSERYFQILVTLVATICSRLNTTLLLQ